MTPSGREILARGIASYAPYQQASGELHDPLFDQPTQYGTPYHAFGHAVLAATSARADVTTAEGVASADVAGADVADAVANAVDRALRGIRAAVDHVHDVDGPATAAGFDRATGAVRRGNHRDFFWPPILKTYRLLRDLGVAGTEELADRIADVDIRRAFRSRPPSNWAAVWLSGEWLRIREGLSPFTVADVDEWLAPFVAERLRIDQGLYEEPGHPNSYDLFTRYHLADLLVEGYDGRWRADLERLLVAGVRRSLGVQLSDGSLASAHRSTGQTWTLGVQCAFFTHAARLLRDRRPNLARRAVDGAGRALAAFARWQRPDGPFSPVENLLPPAFRVGYEGYTADGHDGNLALGFLGVAVLGGLDRLVEPGTGPTPRPAGVHVDHEPVHRVLAHRGPYSVHANGWPAPAYDGFGIVDVTFGPGRLLQLVSSARHVASGAFTNLGLALRETPGRSPLVILAQADLSLTGPITTFGDLVDSEDPVTSGNPLTTGNAGGRGDPVGFELRARPRGQAYEYRLRVEVDTAEIRVVEGTTRLRRYPALLVPYPRDLGTGTLTSVEAADGLVRLRHGAECVEVLVEGAVDHMLDLPYGWETRRGLAGLVRIDLRDRAEEIRYRLRVVS